MPSRTAQLTAAERDFCDIIRQATFSNPFSEQRSELDLRLAGAGTPAEPELALAQTIRRVAETVQGLASRGAASLTAFRDGTDRERLRYLLLFHVFHQHLREFDGLIRTQLAAGDEPCQVPFAEVVLAQLADSGFTADDAARYLAHFFQLRRAFYFIYHELKGRSPCMRRLRMHLWHSTFTHDMNWYEQFCWNRMEDFSTLILGETGSGKGAAAAAIGRSGFIPFVRRRNRFAESFTRSYTAVNLSQFPENLVESEIFGHRQGAFTGAIENHEGYLAHCSPHGAIFLDEIGDVPAHLQLQLLQVLQERTFCAVGSHERLRFSGRVIAATNQDVDRLRREGRFRDDFYYRLCANVIRMPPLRQRLAEDPAELGELVAHVVQGVTGRAAPELAGTLTGMLQREPGPDYAWPGNVRELAQAVRRILVTGSSERVAEGTVRGTAETDLFAQLQASGLHTADELLNAYCAWLVDRHGTYEAAARLAGIDRRTARWRAAAHEKRRAAPP